MLSMGLILAIMSVIVEMFFVVQYEGIRTFMIKHERFGLIFSFALSFFIGEMFGAHGVLALFAGMTSTVITAVIYKLHLLKMVDDFRAHKDAFQAKAQRTWHITKKSVIFWWKIFTFPVRVFMKIAEFCRKTSTSLKTALRKVHLLRT